MGLASYRCSNALVESGVIETPHAGLKDRFLPLELRLQIAFNY